MRRRGELAHSFAIRFDDELVSANGRPGVIVLGTETDAGRWYEVPLDHDQAIEIIDELQKYLVLYDAPTSRESGSPALIPNNTRLGAGR